MSLRLTDEEIETLRERSPFHDGFENLLRSDGPEDRPYLDVRRRYRHLIKLWAGRKAPEQGDVHTSHCCEVHGCKYRDPNCTVERKVLPQDDLCESCQDDLLTLRDLEPSAEEYARSVAIMDPELGNYVLVEGERLYLAKPQADGECLSAPVRLKAQHADLVWAIQTAYLAGLARR